MGLPRHKRKKTPAWYAKRERRRVIRDTVDNLSPMSMRGKFDLKSLARKLSKELSKEMDAKYSSRMLADYAARDVALTQIIGAKNGS